MKIAIVHDYIKEYGGAERVLEALHELYPEAPVYTSVYLPQFLGPHRERFEGWDIRESWVRFLPFRAKLISPLRLIAPFVFRSFDFSEYDVVIVSATGAYTPNMIRIKNHELRIKENQEQKTNDQRPKTIHICYCHTPPHYLYGYATAREWKKNPYIRVIGEIMNHFLRMVDFKSAQNVDFFIANSEEVASRIKKFYRRDATVIYPPVEIMDDRRLKIEDSNLKIEDGSSINHQTSTLKNPSSTIYLLPSKKDYYLAGGRLARAKGMDVIVDAFIKNGKPLKVFGRGFAGYEEELKSSVIARSPFDKLRTTWQSQGDPHDLRSQDDKSRIEFVGEVSDEEKLDLMKNAKAFIFASYDEDFGITPVEAMGVGTPVIAHNSGGVKETVVDGKTGVFYNENTPEKLNSAIKKFEKLKISKEACTTQANKFSAQKFKERIKAFIAQKQ